MRIIEQMKITIERTAATKDKNEIYVKAKIISGSTRQAENGADLELGACAFDRFGYEVSRHKRNTDWPKNSTQQEAKEDSGQTKHLFSGITQSEEYRDTMNRRKNLLLWGMSIPTDNSESARKQIQNFLNKNLDVNITVVNVNRTGARSYAIKLDKISQKREILEKKNILINKGICVYIEPHLTKRERIIQNIIQKKAEDERAKGRYVKVGHQRLFINDERWIWDKSQMKLVEAKAKCVRNESILNITTENDERRRRLKNFIIAGMPFKTHGGVELCMEVQDFLYNTLQVSSIVTNVTKVEPAVCVVRVSKFSQKLQVMRNRRKLNYMEGRTVQIYPDFTEREKQIQNTIQRLANQARRNGSMVRAGYMKLHIDNKQYVWDEEKDRLVELTAAEEYDRALQVLLKEQMERNRRKNNAILTGLSIMGMTKQDLKNTLENLFAQMLRRHVQLRNVTTKRERVVVAEFENLIDKIDVLRNRNNYIGKSMGITIYPDETPRERKMIDEIKRRAMEETMKGNYVKTSYRSIFVNDKRLVWSELQERLVETQDLNQEDFDRMLAPRMQANTMEDYMDRKCNVIVHGMLLETDDLEDLRSKLDIFFGNAMQVAATITNVTKIDNFTCIVRLDNEESKAELLENKHRLATKRIFMKSDTTTIEEEVLQKINQIALEQINQGKNVIVGYMRLYINGEKWVWNDEKEGLVKALPRTNR